MYQYITFIGFLGAVKCLTTSELSKFRTSGNFPSASVSVDSSPQDRHLIYASGMPDHDMTPNVNPNTGSDQNYNISIPKTPTYNQGLYGCLNLGMIGITRTGVAMYNPLTGGEENAVEGSNQETFDSCDGHASPNGAYHYHKIPDSCLYRGEVNEFIGVALDGFPIYGPNASDVDHLITSDDLDKCHGREVNGMYRYHATTTWPYFLGCFKGVVLQPIGNMAYTCNTSSSSGWEDTWTWYLCHCSSDQGGGNGRPECRPENPNRPPDCPNIDDCMNTTPLPDFCLQMCQRVPPPPFCQSTQQPTGSTQRFTTLEVGDDGRKETYQILTLFAAVIFYCLVM